MHLTEKHKIKVNNKYYKVFERFSKYSNNLYNQALFLVKDSLKTYQENPNPNDITKGWLFYKDLDPLCKGMPENFNNYHLLPSQTSQQILRLLDTNLKSSRNALKTYSKDPTNFTGLPKLPNYRKRGSKNILIFTNQQCKNKNGTLHFPKLFEGFTLKLRNKFATIKQVRVVPKFLYFSVEVVYEVPTPSLITKEGLIASIDLGIDNLATVVFSDFSQPVLINGRPLKSLNTYFNYKLSNYKSVLDKTQKGLYTSKRLLRMYEKRNNQITDYLHKASSKLVSLLVEKGTTEVILGHNIHQKQGNKFKNFVQVPVFRFISLLRYKLALNGIKVTEVEESYTSGTSFLDNELPTKVNYDKTRRIHRGLFKSNQGKLINSDVNAAYQIMRKVYDWVLPVNGMTIFNPTYL